MNTKQNYVKVGRVLSALSGSAKITLLSILALTATVIAATLLQAQSGGNQPAQNHLEGTWMAKGAPGIDPNLVSYLSDGRVIFTRPITVVTGPNSFALVSTGHGEWIRTGNHEFASTVFLLSGEESVNFNVLVKLTHTIKLNDTSDEITVTGMVSGFDPAGNPVFSFPVNQTFKRVVAGQ